MRLPVGDKFEFKKIDPEKIVSKTEEAGDQLTLLPKPILGLCLYGR